MRDETPEQPAPLRTELTTGSCATATSLAAARLPLAGRVCEHARKFALSVVPEATSVECFAIDRQGRIVGAAQ